MTRTFLKTAMLLAGASVLSLSTVAQAEDVVSGNAAGAADVDPTDTGLTDIVVTAEKRETTLQEAPIAITAISGDALKQRNLNQLNDLNGYVPGLTIAKSGGAERLISIRGVGYETANNPNSQPGVAFHIDGVYIAHVMALGQDLLDVDRVEVLRGPQGTVFGETSTGGAINVITRKPVLGEASGSASVSYGNYNFVKANTTANIPISDTVAFRASLQYLRHDGYGVSVAVPGASEYELDDANNVGYRASLIFKPNDTFTALLEGQGFYADRNGALQKDITDTTPGARRVAQDLPSKFKLDTKMIYLTLSQEIGDFAVAKSVTGYQYLNKQQTSDNDRLASPFYFDHLILWQDKSKTFSQELTLNSPTNKQFEWILGAFFLRQTALQNITEVTSPFAAAVTLPDGTGIKFQTKSPFQHTSLAGYANGTWHVSDQLDVYGGTRYSWDKITAQPSTYFGLFGPTAPGRATSGELTGKIGAQYKFAPFSSVFFNASHGYKPTGLNFNNAAQPLRVPASFKEETINAVEFGTKNDLFDRKVRFNATAYYYWYNNFQFTAEDPKPFSGGTDNIPKAEIYGAEFEASILPVEGLRFDGTLALGKGKFKGDFLTIDAQTAAIIRNQKFAELGFPAAYFSDPRIVAAVDAARLNLNGRKLPKLPGVQALGSATYTADLGPGKLTLRGEVIYRSTFNYRVFAIDALDRVPAYTLFNGFIEYAPNEGNWRFSVSAQNIGNKDGINSRFSDPYGSGTTSVEYISPRQVFGTLSFNF